MTATLEIAGFVPATRAEGPGLRAAVWVQGCTIRCPGCCNPELFSRGDGTVIVVRDLVARIDAARVQHPALRGITILGGEPLQQLDGVTALARACVERALDVLVYTGFALAAARRRPGFAALWRHVDTIVAGPYVARLPEPAGGRRTIGSRNQVLAHRTDRLADPALWSGRPRVEATIRADGTIAIVGDPAAAAALLRALG